MSLPDVVIVGGGVIGLASAWRMAKDGLRVTVLDAGQLGGESSRAAAGILGPLAESSRDDAFTALLWHGLERFPGFVDALREDTGIDPELDLTGILRLVAADEAAAYRDSLAWRRRYAALSVREETWPGFALAVWSPREGQVYGPRYLQALADACATRGVNLQRGRAATGLVSHGGRVTGAQTTSGPAAAGVTLVAAGVWTDQVLQPLGIATGVRPIRGQVLAVRAPAPHPEVRYAAIGYVARKRNGVCIIGATEDDAGYDGSVSLGGIVRLAEKAARLAPELSGASFQRAWAGLRPKTADGLPVVGWWPGVEGLMVATGHYRNGILLSALTAEWTAALARGGGSPAPGVTASFGPERLLSKPGSPAGPGIG
jgi:glycine oxidase